MWLFLRRAGRTSDQEEGEGLPGGEAMLGLLTRLMEYQTKLSDQLEVGHTPSLIAPVIRVHLTQSCSGAGVSPVDENVLLLRATSQAAVSTVRDCLALIRLQQVGVSVWGCWCECVWVLVCVCVGGGACACLCICMCMCVLTHSFTCLPPQQSCQTTVTSAPATTTTHK